MIEEDVHQLSFGEYVELYTLDLTKLGGSIYYFTPNTTGSSASLLFQGKEYIPVDIQISGFETTTQGSLPQPTIKLANSTRAFTGITLEFDDLIGAKVTRIRTLAKYLDNGESPDPNSYFPPDVFYVNQKTAHNKLYIEFKLASAIDVEGVKLPKRLVVRDYCSHLYRIYDATKGAFDYTNVTCPYVNEARLFDVNDNAVDNPINDVCGKRLNSCQLRFGKNAQIPGLFFPGAGQLPNTR